MIERQTAVKTHIKTLTSGAWVEKEGMEPSFVLTETGMQIARARIMGTVVSKFISEDGNFASMTIDDFTDTIRAKAFKETGLVSGVEIGSLIDVIGKVREYNSEVYIVPEVIRRIENPNLELLRRMEIAKMKVPLQKPIAKPTVPAKIPEAKTEEIDRELLRKEVIAILNKNEKGILFSDIVKAVKAPENMTESIVNELLSEGMCYEPTPGKIRKI